MIKFGVTVRTVGLATFGAGQLFTFGPDIQFTKKDDRPYIPGSSLKGALRSAATRIARAYGFTSCGKIEASEIGSCSCDVCTLFGKPSETLASQLIVEDLESKLGGRLIPITRVTLEDKTQRAKEGYLYTQEHACLEEFEGRVILIRPEKRLQGLLLLAMAELRTGRIGKDTIMDLKLIETRELKNELEEKWQELLGFLETWLWEGRV